MSKSNIIKVLSIVVCIALVQPIYAAGEGVKAWEETLTLPSYKLNPPEIAPVFDCDWSYQRARRSVYPYPLNDNMTREMKPENFTALYLENKYVKLCVLPQIGGRLFYAIDKTNNYDIFYHQDVIKPANVGMTGAWISGGVEWNVFHHHRATSHAPCNYKIESNTDGSMTIWLGETEWRHRMSWAIGITLHPDKSYIEISGRLSNQTENVNTMLYWSNVSTAANENYQIIFPPTTEFGTFHCKSSFCHWPITKEPYNGIEEYANGVDASWWKNNPYGVSIFVHDLKDDFIAGYDHGKDAGTMLVGNHNIVKGGKFWSWGYNSGWPTKILTENAGHYIELMTGAYSDNQPDYSWLYPYEVKKFSQYWYGIRNIGGAKKASKVAAINLDVQKDGKVRVAANATEYLPQARVLLLKNGETIFDKSVDISPEKPFSEYAAISGEFKDTDLTMKLIRNDGKELLSYTPIKNDASKPLPEIVAPPLPPSEIKNIEECLLVGMRNYQFFNPFIKPEDYFEEVLRRDSGNVRANIMMGTIWRKRGDNQKAEKYFRTAYERQRKDYTNPKDCEAIYNLGLILKAEGKTEDAIEMLYKAVWNYEYNSAANYQLAQIYAAQKDYENALERLNEAIFRNNGNLDALNLKTTIYRLTGDKKSALECIESVLEVDPLNSYALYEKSLIEGGTFFPIFMRDEVQSYLELALKYLHNSFEDECVKLLSDIEKRKPSPIVKMWLAYLADCKGNKESAKEFYQKALSEPIDYCNPFRLETVAVLKKAKEYFPNEAKIYYYLGNLYYDKQPEKAVAEWEKCIELDGKFAYAHRNIGWAYWKYFRDYSKSMKYYSRAVDLAPDQALFLEEIDQVAEANHDSPESRYNRLKKLHDTCVKRYYPLAAEVVTGTFVGDYDYVLKLLKECYFPTREGVANFHDVFVDALLMAAESKAAKGDFSEAKALCKQAFTYPENHQVFYYDTRNPRDAQIYYTLASICERSKDKSSAEANYKKAAEVNTKKTNYRYWRALALEKLGKSDEAKAIFNDLVEEGKNGIVKRHINFYGSEGTTGNTVEFINSCAYYTMGLGQAGLGNREEAKASFVKSVELNPNYLWSNVMLKSIK